MRCSIFLVSSVFVLVAPVTCGAQTPLPTDPDISNCDNCDVFPNEWLSADPDQLIDLDGLPPERRLDFLVGEWALFFPVGKLGDEDYHSADEPIAHESFEWYVPDKVIQADQIWGSKEDPGFRARTDFRYVAEQDRWQMTWLAPTASGFFTGGYDGHGVISFVEYLPTGDRSKLSLTPGMRYVFRNISKDQFVAEEWRQKKDGIGPFTILRWRVLYRRARSD
jgi:hypothetical protein